MTDDKSGIEERLNRHPNLKKRISELLKIVENAEGDAKKASEAEQMVIEELQKMGNEVLHSWAKNREEQEVEEIRKSKKPLKRKGLER